MQKRGFFLYHIILYHTLKILSKIESPEQEKTPHKPYDTIGSFQEAISNSWRELVHLLEAKRTEGCFHVGGVSSLSFHGGSEAALTNPLVALGMTL